MPPFLSWVSVAAIVVFRNKAIWIVRTIESHHHVGGALSFNGVPAHGGRGKAINIHLAAFSDFGLDGRASMAPMLQCFYRVPAFSG